MATPRTNGNIAFLNKEGKIISKLDWTQLRSSPSYCNIRKYEGEKVVVNAYWSGRISDATDKPQEYWYPFKVDFYNVIVTGDRPGTFKSKQVLDDLMSCCFKTEGSALDYYFSVLGDMNLLTFSEDYEGNEDVTEIGNTYTNLPTNTNLMNYVSPQTEKKEKLVSKNFGSW